MNEDLAIRFFDHTGDSGVDVRGQDPDAVVALVARAFLTLLTDAPLAVSERAERRLVVEGVDAADTLVAFANELLYLFETERFLCARFEPTCVEETRIEGVARGEPFDPARHPIARPVKAVTHHGAAFEEADDGTCSARLVFDL